jgi:hypothetical protein
MNRHISLSQLTRQNAVDHSKSMPTSPCDGAARREESNGGNVLLKEAIKNQLKTKLTKYRSIIDKAFEQITHDDAEENIIQVYLYIFSTLD